MNFYTFVVKYTTGFYQYFYSFFSFNAYN